MRCAQILSLTFVDAADNDDEMNASYEAMATKGTKHGAKLINKKVIVQNGDDAAAIFQTASVNIPSFNPALSTGLYLAAHYRDTDTFPTMKTLAQLTAKYLEAGLRFTKINLNACFSAGKIGHQIELGIKYEPNMILVFCNDLVETLNDATFFANQLAMPLANLNNCMVAGYRSQIVLYKPGHAFFTPQQNDQSKWTDPQKWAKKLDARIGNVFRDSGGYSRTHPQNQGPLNTKLSGASDIDTLNSFSKYKNLIATKNYKEVTRPTPYFEATEYPSITINELALGTATLNEIKATNFFKDQQLLNYFTATLQYIMKKKIVKFNNTGHITQISISDYSDNPDIKQMVTAVTAFNIAMGQLGVRIIL